MKRLPTASELKGAFTDFAKFTFDLLETIETKPNHLKFAAVNSQIALELFLKYLYVKNGQANDIQKFKKGKVENDFVDFSKILNHFYSSRKWSFGEKRELVKLMQTRNSIVHRGQHSKWDKDLAKSLVRTLFFIHATAWSELREILFFDNNTPHKIAWNSVWREGVESFVEDLSKIFKCAPLACLACHAKSVVNGDVMVLNENHNENNLICLTCLSSIDTSEEAGLIKCYICQKNSYIIDAFNEQDDQLHVAKCSECMTHTWVRICRNCENFYHPSCSDEVQVNGRYFCSVVCSECYEEDHPRHHHRA